MSTTYTVNIAESGTPITVAVTEARDAYQLYAATTSDDPIKTRPQWLSGQESFTSLDINTLSKLNTIVTDATLDDSSSARTPTAHQASHNIGGSDPLDPDDIGAANSHVTVRNNSGGLIPLGSAVRVTNSVGQIPTIALADSSTEEGIESYFGIVTDASGISNNSNGDVQILDTVEGLDTSDANEGDIAYIGPSGGLVYGEPTTGFIRKVGIVKNAHITQGKILLINDYRGSVIGNSIKNAVSATEVRTLIESNTDYIQFPLTTIGGTLNAEAEIFFNFPFSGNVTKFEVKAPVAPTISNAVFDLRKNSSWGSQPTTILNNNLSLGTGIFESADSSIASGSVAAGDVGSVVIVSGDAGATCANAVAIVTITKT